ncbi:MAG: cytochrome c oxidase subunit II [Ktedonobacteraceae bacterium]|nr:cytochrome c oxidase subunit II [Ktedonobacteraceae bacterium]
MSETNLIQGDTTSGESKQQEPHHLRRVLIIWAVLSILGIVAVVGLTKYAIPPSASDVGVSNDFTLLVFTALAVPVAMFVFVFLAYSMLVFRVKERPTEDGAFLKPRPMLQVGWMGITGALCLFLLIWGLFGFYQNTVAASANPLIVQVTGQQWLWTFYYPQYKVSSHGQELELPVNRPVQFSVSSKDVLHGFSIRSLGIRIDANPGQITTIPALTPNQIGDYSVACVELCGLYHSYMWSAVHVVSESSFNSWITNQGGNP